MPITEVPAAIAIHTRAAWCMRHSGTGDQSSEHREQISTPQAFGKARPTPHRIFGKELAHKAICVAGAERLAVRVVLCRYGILKNVELGQLLVSLLVLCGR